VQPFLDQLKGYVAKIEAAKTANGYPDAFPGAPQIPGVTVVYHEVGTSYALSLEVQRREANLQALPACIVNHRTRPDDLDVLLAAVREAAARSLPFPTPVAPPDTLAGPKGS